MDEGGNEPVRRILLDEAVRGKPLKVKVAVLQVPTAVEREKR